MKLVVLYDSPIEISLHLHISTQLSNSLLLVMNTYLAADISPIQPILSTALSPTVDTGKVTEEYIFPSSFITNQHLSEL